MKINGKPIRNATKPIKINIIQRDITQAKAKDPGACAAAKAILREGLCKQARVHLDRTYLELEDYWIRFRTPNSLRNEIIAIDRGGAFMPGEHELKAISKSRVKRLGKRQGSSTNDRNQRHKKATRPRHRIEGVRPKGANI